MRMGRRQYQKGEKTMTTQQHNTAARTDSQGAQTMTIHRERRRRIGSVSSTLRGVALAGMALFLVGCDSGGGVKCVESDTPSNRNLNRRPSRSPNRSRNRDPSARLKRGADADHRTERQSGLWQRYGRHVKHRDVNDHEHRK
jgi:hypothetical protein